MYIEIDSEWVADEDEKLTFKVSKVEKSEDGIAYVVYQVFNEGVYIGTSETEKGLFLDTKTPVSASKTYDKGFKEGYNQACKEFVEEGDEFWDDEESSEEVGEEYCFIKDLQKLLGDEYKHPENPMSAERKHSHYFKDVRHLDYVDIYQICKLFPVDDDSGAIVHARKKLLVAGGRGAGKNMIRDITEARDTLSRYLQIEGHE